MLIMVAGMLPTITRAEGGAFVLWGLSLGSDTVGHRLSLLICRGVKHTSSKLDSGNKIPNFSRSWLSRADHAPASPRECVLLKVCTKGPSLTSLYSQPFSMSRFLNFACLQALT
jgi:hypothetical protein